MNVHTKTTFLSLKLFSIYFITEKLCNMNAAMVTTHFIEQERK